MLPSNLPSLGGFSKLCFPVRIPPAYAHSEMFWGTGEVRRGMSSGFNESRLRSIVVEARSVPQLTWK